MFTDLTLNQKESLVTNGNYDVVKPLAFDENKELYFIASPDNPY